jgi:hypothetical protein
MYRNAAVTTAEQNEAREQIQILQDNNEEVPKNLYKKAGGKNALDIVYDHRFRQGQDEEEEE